MCIRKPQNTHWWISLKWLSNMCISYFLMLKKTRGKKNKKNYPSNRSFNAWIPFKRAYLHLFYKSSASFFLSFFPLHWSIQNMAYFLCERNDFDHHRHSHENDLLMRKKITTFNMELSHFQSNNIPRISTDTHEDTREYDTICKNERKVKNCFFVVTMTHGISMHVNVQQEGRKTKNWEEKQRTEEWAKEESNSKWWHCWVIMINYNDTVISIGHSQWWSSGMVIFENNWM